MKNTKITTRREKALSQSLWAWLSYAFISIVLTYPMIFRLNEFAYTGAEPLPPGSDIFTYLWDMWWFKHAIINHINPFWSGYIFYPQGASLLFTLANIIWSIIALPLQPFLSLLAIYNLFFILSLILSGMAAFWLIRYLTRNSWAAFIGGAIFAFAPYHFVHIGHMTVFSVQWLPLFVLFFLKMFNEENWRNAVLAGIFWAATCYSDLNYAVFLALFVIIFFIFHLKYQKERMLSGIYLKKVLIMFGVLFLTVGPYATSLFLSIISGRAVVSVPLQNSVSQSADLLSFFVPSFMHPLFGKLVQVFYEHITTYGGHYLGGYIEVTAYAGFATIILAVIAWRNFGWQRLRFWIFAAAFFFVLTLGPVLKIGGLVQIPAGWLHLDKIAVRIDPGLDPLALEMMKRYIGIPLPYLFLHFTPIFSGSESAGRMDIMFVLFWAVICGFGVKAILDRAERNNFTPSSKNSICILILMLILFEYASFPIKMMDLPASSFYKKLATDKDDYALMDLPVLNNEPDSDLHSRSNRILFAGFANTSSKRSMYNQTIHHKKVVNGFTCRLQANLRDFIDNTPVVRQLAYPLEIDEQALVDWGVLEKYKIKYIVLHREYLRAGEFIKLTSFLSDKFEEVFNDREIVVYQTYH